MVQPQDDVAEHRYRLIVATVGDRIYALDASSGKVIINARSSAIATEQVLLKRSCGQGPAMKRGAAHAEWVIDVLVWASAEAVE